MIHDDRLEEKLVFYPEITIESIQLIGRSTAIHSANSNVNIGVQETNSPRSIDEISLINTPRCAAWISVIKRVKCRPLDRDPTVQMSSARFNQDRYNPS